MIHGRSYVCEMKFHLVFAVKYRKKIINNDIHAAIYNSFKEAAELNNFKILAFNSDLDHVHILIETTPQISIPSIVKAMKGRSSKQLFNKFPLRDVFYGNTGFWNPSYGCFTVGESNEEKIKIYIDNQNKDGKRYFNSK